MIEAAWNTYIKRPLPWVRTLGPEYWKAQKIGDPHGPDKYKNLQPDSYRLLSAIQQVSRRHDFLLDLGCGPGRHMRALRRRGYAHVTGLDLPQTFEDTLPGIKDQWYDLVFTFGMTIELVPPDFPICHHLARIAKKAVVLMVQEHGVPYPRLYGEEFDREGFVLRSYEPTYDSSLYVFTRR